MRVGRRLGAGQDRGEAGLGAFQQLAPFVEPLALEHFRQPSLTGRPAGRITLLVQEFAAEPQFLQQCRIELRLATSDRHVAAVGGLVDVVERRPEVEDVGAGDVGPQALGAQSVEEGAQQRHAVDHRGIDNLARPGVEALEERAEDADHQQHPTAAVVAQQVERGSRRRVAPTQRVECSGEGYVVDVVPGHLGVRPLLSPARDTGVDQALVAAKTDLGPHAEPFGDPRPVAFDQDVGSVDQAKRRGQAVGLLEVDRDRSPPAGDEVDPAVTADHALLAGLAVTGGRLIGPVYANHLRAEISEDHDAERTRPTALQFYDSKSGEWPCH